MERKPPRNIGLTAEQVHAALVAADGSPTKAARNLGVARNTIIYWMRTRNLSRKVAIVQE